MFCGQTDHEGMGNNGKREMLFSALIFAAGIVLLAAAPVVLFRGAGFGGPGQAQGQEQTQEREWQFGTITVEDAGKPLWEKLWGEGDDHVVIVIRHDYFSEKQSVAQQDGRIRAEDVDTMHLNNVWFSVPGGGTRVFVNPVFRTELMAEGEWEAIQEWDDRDLTSRRYEEAFDEGMERARELIREGYLQGYLEEYLKQYPEIEPDKREWKLEYTGGGWTYREEDNVSWCELYYRLVTTAENGEVIPVGWLNIHQGGRGKDHAVTGRADYSMHPGSRGMWKLLEDTATDRGEVWIDQLPGEDFADEAAVEEFVRRKGTGFLLPEGADEAVEWTWEKRQGYWYDYLIGTGRTADYELTMAVPLMPEGSGGWYLASRIHKDAADKQDCAYVLSVMMQTLRTEPYVYTVREGDTLTYISEKYIQGQDAARMPGYLAERNGIADPDLIYPGQQIALPETCTGKDWKAGGQP